MAVTHSTLREASERVLMPQASPKVSIITLTWNSYEVTRDCLLTLKKLDYPNFEIIVVDNGSTDGSQEQLDRDFPEVRHLRNRTNLGFSGGNNVAIRDALARNADYLLLLNNDTIVSPTFLRELVQVAESDEKIGLLNPKIYYFEPPDRIWYAGGLRKPWRVFPKHLGLHKRDDGSYNETREVTFITGCALLVKAAVVRKIGLLDEIFFLGFEDADWSVRALQAGFKGVYVPAAVIWHRDAYVTRKNFGRAGRDFYTMRNTILFARKHLQRRHWPLFMMSVARYVAYRTIVDLTKADVKTVRALYQGLWSGCSTKVPRGEAGACVAV
jgi:GT2 family glycosyltransferase